MISVNYMLVTKSTVWLILVYMCASVIQSYLNHKRSSKTTSVPPFQHHNDFEKDKVTEKSINIKLNGGYSHVQFDSSHLKVFEN